jgi:molybdopterin-guanine dinucleotide biosynthesis protein A
MKPVPPGPSVTAILLAGGEGRRMGGQDKGLTKLKGKPLVQWVLTRIQHQVGEILISANRHIDEYAALGYPVIKDKTEGFVGPLAGIARGLLDAKNELVLSVPCDTPFLPDDLVSRLTLALNTGTHDIAVPRVAGRSQNVISLMRRHVGANLAIFLSQGGRKVQDWQAGLNTAFADFSDEAAYFVNINSPEQLAALDAKGRETSS